MGHGVFETNDPGTNAVTGINENHSQPGSGVVGESDAIGVLGISHTMDGVVGRSDSTTNVSAGVLGEHSGVGIGVLGFSENGTGIWGKSASGQAGFFEGNVDIAGNLVLFKDVIVGGQAFITEDLVIFYDVEVNGQAVIRGDLSAHNVHVTGADCAEEFAIAPTVEIEPGMVMVLDQDGALQPSLQAYDKRVVGVISGAGDYTPGLVLDRQPSSDHRQPVALVGKVYCKVDASYASIEVGDLLTTSSTPGHAMKASDPSKAFGAVIGKALCPLKEGQCIIPILVALQ